MPSDLSYGVLVAMPENAMKIAAGESAFVPT
jgi:hypothetical protein